MALFKRRAKPSPEYTEERVALLARVARQSQVDLILHPDTWDFIATRCAEGSEQAHFKAPDEEAIAHEDAARLRVPVSGRTLTAIARQMYLDGVADKFPRVETALGVHVSEAIEAAVKGDDQVREIIIDASPDDPRD